MMLVTVVMRYDPYFNEFMFSRVLPLASNLDSVEREVGKLFEGLMTESLVETSVGAGEDDLIAEILLIRPRIIALIYNDRGEEVNRLALPKHNTKG